MAESTRDSQTSPTRSDLPSTLEEVAQDVQNMSSLAHAQPETGVSEIVKLFREVLTRFHKDLDSSKEDQKKSDEGDSKASPTPSRSMIPKVRKVDFEHFKNRFNEDDGHYMVEALVAGSNLSQSIRVEAFRRNGVRTAPETTMEVPILGATTFPPDSTIQRVRIQSKAILNYLSKFSTEASELTEARTFLYPFRPLIHSHESMRKVLDLLVQRCSVSTAPIGEVANQEPEKNHPSQPGGDLKTAIEPNDNAASTAPVIEKPRGPDSTATVALDPGFDTTDTLAEIKAYVEFVEEELMPLLAKYSDSTRQTVTFDDLWLLFNPGEYLVMPTGPQSVWKRERNIFRLGNQEVEEKTNPSQRLWRLFGVTTPDGDPNFSSAQTAKKTPITVVDPFDDNPDPTNSCFYLHCYHIDFDESKSRAVTKKIRISPFKGTISIKSLPAYPSRYTERFEELKEELKNQGDRFKALRRVAHVYYKGWSVAHHPDGTPMQTNDRFVWEVGNLESQYIDSEVIIDFEETVNTHPQWSPSFKPPDSDAGVWSHSNDNFEIMQWSDYSRSELKSQQNDVVQTADGVAMAQRKSAIENDEFLAESKDRGSHTAAGGDEERDGLSEEDLMLLPQRLFAYSLRDRRHVALDLQHISTLPQQHGVFEQLKIPRVTKDLIRSLVDEHFEKKRLEQLMSSSEKGLMTQDLIGGKGKGLTILLHGVPGVGKTATAEAVALESRRPLFSLNPGDIGSTADDVNKNLRHFFRLANKWNCVLLLDEADAFLSQRSAFDTNRNAMVSVFLQALEYYDGILFLTTNRVGQMDEAFQSRIHLKLYYRPLDEKQTEQIFQANIKKLRENDAIRRRINKMPELAIDEARIIDFALRPFQGAANVGDTTLSPAQWNGRQIRNAFHLASSLAYRSMAEELARIKSDGGTSRESSVVLDDAQFQTVVKTMQAFDKYIEKTKGFSAADLAFMAGNRADFWRDLEPRGADYHPSPAMSTMDTRSPFYRNDHPVAQDPPQRSSQAYRGMYTPETPASRSNMSFLQEGPYAPRPRTQFEGPRAPQVPRRRPESNIGQGPDQHRPRQHADYTERSPLTGFDDPPSVRGSMRSGGDLEYEDQYGAPSPGTNRPTRGEYPQRMRASQEDVDDDYT